MKNITDFNQFKNIKYDLITEAVKSDDNRYFENVKGNMAGAETTLIGSAVIKLFGFIKRKGIQAYLNISLKPALGRVYFNNILRYVVTSDNIKLPKEKISFEIKKIENNRGTGSTLTVTFKKDNLTGIYAFIVGASVYNGNDILGDGEYTLLYYIGSRFKVENGIITTIDGGSSLTETEMKKDKEEIETNSETIIDDNTEKEITDNINNLKSNVGSVKAESDIIKFCDDIKNAIKNANQKSLTIDVLTKIYHKITEEIYNVRNLGLDELKRMLKSKTIDEQKRTELKTDILQYEANLLELTLIQNYVYLKIKQFNESISISNNYDKLNEAEKMVTVNTKGTPNTNTSSKTVSDELQELQGKFIDFNDKDFYSQFDDISVKTKVTNIILQHKSDLIKIQLQAERLIGDSSKLKNNWERMVNSVLGKYAKFMLTDKVNPITLRKEGSIDFIKEVETDLSNKNKKTGDTIGLLSLQSKLSSNETFNKNAELVNANKKLRIGDVAIINATINEHNKLWVCEFNELNIGNKKRVAYRILGLITPENQTKMQEKNVTDFKQFINTNINNLFCDQQNMKTQEGLVLNAVYIIGGTQNFFVSDAQKTTPIENNCSIVLLYLKGGVYNEETSIFKIRNRASKQIISLDKEVISTEGIVKNFKSKLSIFNTMFYRLINKEQFIEYDKIIINKVNHKYTKNINNIIPTTKK